MKLQALKSLYQLPIRTPNAAVYLFGTLYTKQRVDKCQLIYLHKILNQPASHWTTKTLFSLEEKNVGWSKHIKEIITVCNITINLQEIKMTPWPEWKQKINTAIETEHIERLKSECYKITDGKMSLKTTSSAREQRCVPID